MHRSNYFRRAWDRWFSFHWGLGLGLILLFGILRFIFVLGANSGGTYSYTSLLFLLMWFLPFILLKKAGRRHIGFKKPEKRRWWLVSFLLGIGMCTLVYLLGIWLFGLDSSNWFVYISRSYESATPLDIEHQRFLIFVIVALVGISFSPIGEEFLYRGLIHQCFVPRLGENGASVVDSTAFALTHLAHFGILYELGGWEFRSIPALLWVGLMFLTARLFYYCKALGKSLYLAVICHAGFNLAMAYFICYHIL